MKKIAVLLIACLFSFSSFAYDKNVNPIKEELRSTIVNLLGKANFAIEKNVKATVSFIVNRKGEFVILDINCVTPQVCYFIKNKLNYKKVPKNFKRRLTVYKVPIHLIQG